MIRILLGVVAMLQMPIFAFAQDHAPYAEMKGRTIKALSQQQIADLKAGKGMAMALPAELNGYPGPLHVLEFADALNLTAQQRQRTNDLYRNMREEAVPLGEQLIESEATLDRLFASRAITPVSLNAATGDIAHIQGQLRQTHLKYHLAMIELLSPQQIQRYQELRGYSAPAGASHHRKPHH